jgi:hypothetical protein
MNSMDTPPSAMFTEALRLLNEYYRSIVTKVAEEIVENRDTFDLPYTGRAEEIIDRYGLHLQSVARINCDLMTMANLMSQQEAAAAGSMPGLPVAPSGRPIDPDAVLEPGTPILVEWCGSWWRANVVCSEPDGRVRIHYAGWGDNWDETVPRTRLQEDGSKSSGDG